MHVFSAEGIKPFVLSITDGMLSVSKAIETLVDKMPLGAE